MVRKKDGLGEGGMVRVDVTKERCFGVNGGEDVRILVRWMEVGGWYAWMRVNENGRRGKELKIRAGEREWMLM